MKSIFKVEDVGINGCLEDGQIVLTINPLEICETGENIDAVFKELMAFYQFNAQKNTPLINTQKKRPQKSKVAEDAEKQPVVAEIENVIEDTKQVLKLNIGDKILEEGAYKGLSFNDAYEKEPEAIAYLAKHAKNARVQNDAVRFLRSLEEVGK